jgi:hypothetical protein
MSEWNLSVRLTGQGSDLASMLRSSAREARKLTDRIDEAKRALAELRAAAAGDIRVRLDIDADHLRSDVRAALTGAAAGQGIRIRLDLDADHLRDEVRTAVTTAGAGQGLGVRLTLTDTMQLRRDVEAAVRWAAWGHRIEIPIGLADPMQLRRDVSAAVRWASMNQTIRVRVDPDTSALGGLARRIGSASGSDGGGFGEALKGLLLLAPAIIPVVAGLSPLAAGMATAGAASAAFGIALAGQIGPLSEAADAEKKYQDAVTQHGENSQQAMEASLAYQQQLAKLPPATQQAAAALSILKDDFHDWSDDLSSFTMSPVTRGLQVLQQIMPRLTPEVITASAQLNRLVTVAGGAVTTPGFDALSDKFAEFSTGTLRALTNDVIHFMRVLSEGQVSGPLGTFIDYARQNGPAAREAIANLADAVSTLLEGAADAGPGMLTLVNAAAKLVAALPPELVGVILQIATALKLLKLAGIGYSAISTGITTLTTSITTLSTTSAAAGGGIAGLRAALASLSTGAKIGLATAAIGGLLLVLHEMSDNKPAVEVDALSSSLNTLISTGKLTGALKTNFDEISSSIAMVSKGASDNKIAQLTSDFGSWVGIATGPSISTARKNVDAWDKSMANLVKAGHPKEAAAQYDLLKRSWKAGGGDMSRLKKFTNDYNDALADQKFEAKMAAESMGLFGAQAQAVQAKLDAQKQSADGLRQSLQALADVNRASAGAMNAFEQSIDDAAKAARDNSGALSMQHGQLDLNSQKARDAESALRNLAASTVDAATKAREQGQSWESVNAIYKRGEDTFVSTAQKMGLTKKQAEALARAYINIPDKKSITLEMRTEDAISGLNSVIAAMKATPDAKSVTVKALTADAVSLLKSLGFTVKQLPDGRFKVTAETGNARSNIAAVQRARDALKNKAIDLTARDRASATARAIQAAIDKIRGKTVTITTVQHTLGVQGTAGRNARNYNADGSVMDYYADGGVQRGGVRRFAGGSENHVAQIAPAGSWRVWGEPETDGEGYVPFARSKRPRSRAITEEIVRRLGGDPEMIRWNANGSVTHYAGGGFSYTPPGSLKSASDIQSAYSNSHQSITKDEYNKKLRSRANAVDSLRTAESRLATVRKHHHTHAQLVAAENAVAKARRSLATATDAAKNAEARYKKQFSLSDWSHTLAGAVKSNKAYEANLSKIAARGGGDVIDQLRDMGAEGAAMVSALAKASGKQFTKIVTDLRKLGPLAKATLADYTKQMTAATKTNTAFEANLAKLAAMGFGDLAGQLAAQGDESAQKIAAEAVKSKSAASKADAAAKANAKTLSDEQLAELVSIIASIKTSKTGIHDVAGATGLGEDEIIAVANKAKSQIGKSLGSRSARFLADLGKANKGLAYANGGIRSGIYATAGGAVTFAEPSTGGEAYIPLGANKRRSATAVLTDVAGRFGLGMTDAGANRVVIIREQGPLVREQHWHIADTPRSRDLARQIDDQTGYQLRRLARGGVGR